MSDDPFVVSVAAFVERAREKADLALRATAYAALARVMQLTPVNTGYLRASWQVSLLGSTEAITSRSNMTVLATLRMGDRVVISNPVRYAMRIEYGFVGTDKLGRRYNQQGVGMMHQTISELAMISQQATAKVMGA